MNTGCDRRQFLKLGMMTTAAAAASSLPKFSWANVKTRTLSDVMDMTPEQMAADSSLVTDSLAYLNQAAASIKNPELRGAVAGILRNPAPTIAADLMDEANRKQVYEELKAKGLMEKVEFKDFLPPTKNPYKSPHPFMAAPGSGYQSHHAYPGGVVSHTALNTMVSLALYRGYKDVYGYGLDRDVVIASQVLHDLHKPWVFQWGKTGETRTELKLAGTGEHHVYSVAESVHRGLPAVSCVAQACAHNHPGWPNDEAGPVNWIKAACVLLGKCPVKAGLLAADQKTLPLPRRMENFVCHLGDHDWVLTVPAAKWTVPVLKEIAAEKYNMTEAELNGRKFNQLRNYAFSQASIMTLYNTYSTRGKDALAYSVMSIVAPA